MKRGAFTLVEIILAIFISSLVMFGACVLMFNTAMVMRYFDEAEPFDVHVNGVESFLSYTLKNAVAVNAQALQKAKSSFASNTPTTSDPAASSAAANAANTSAATTSSSSGYGKISLAFLPDDTMGDPKICFGVNEDRPFFISSRIFSPEKIAWLEFREREGIFLVWTFTASESYSGIDENPVYESLVSPYVKAVEYTYIDSDGKWYYESDMKKSPAPNIAANTVPNFIKIEFEKGSEKYTRYISLDNLVDSQFTPRPASSSGANSRNRNRNSGGGGGGGRGGGGQGGGSGIGPSGPGGGNAPSGGSSGQSRPQREGGRNR